MSNNSGCEQISYADQVVIVTGAASGIGRSAAQLIAARGASVICVDLNQAGLDQTVSEIKSAGGVAESATLDISNQSGVTMMPASSPCAAVPHPAEVGCRAAASKVQTLLLLKAASSPCATPGPHRWHTRPKPAARHCRMAALRL